MIKILFFVIFLCTFVIPINSQNNLIVLENINEDFNSDGILDRGIISQDTSTLNPIFKIEIFLKNQFNEEKQIISNEIKLTNSQNENSKLFLYEKAYMNNAFVFSFKINKKIHSYYFYYSNDDFEMLNFSTFELIDGKMYINEVDLRNGKVVFNIQDLKTKEWSEREKKMNFPYIPKLSNFNFFENEWLLNKI